MLAGLYIDALAARLVLELSGSKRQRVALALCALRGAPLLLLDKPVTFQNPAHQSRVARWLSSSLPRDQALVISAHDVNWIARTATHVLALLPDGRCEQGAAGAMLDAGLLVCGTVNLSALKARAAKRWTHVRFDGATSPFPHILAP